MEYIAIGFLAGTLFAAIMILVMTGGLHDMDKAERNGNSNSIDTDNVADRDNRSVDRDNIDVEEVINVLNVLRMVTTGSETAKLDYAVECVEKVDRLHKWIDLIEGLEDQKKLFDMEGEYVTI